MKKRILIAENNDIEGPILERTLKNKGYEVLRASDGMQALELLVQSTEKHEVVDLLITDLMMPGLSGIELLWHLKEKNILHLQRVSADSLFFKRQLDFWSHGVEL